MRPMTGGFMAVLASCLVLAAAPVSAQQYHWRTYGELDGLPSSTVLDVAQDQDGCMWFATARGLSRYDSTEWQDVGPTGNLPTLAHRFIGRDRQGRWWTLCRGTRQRVYRREGAVWHEIPLPDKPFKTRRAASAVLGETPAGETYLVLFTLRGQAAIYLHDTWHSLTVGEGPTSIRAAACSGGVLAAATDRGLFTVDLDGWDVQATSVKRPVHAVCAADSGGSFFVVGDDWIGRGPVDRIAVLAEDLPLTFDQESGVVVAQAEGAGGLYFGDRSHVYFFHPHYGLETLSQENGLQSVGATGFCLDREGSIWISGMRGVSELVNRSLAGYDSRQGLFANEVSAVLPLGADRIVLGHVGGLTVMGSTIRTIDLNHGNPFEARVTDLAESPQHEVWFAAFHMGVGRLLDDGTVAVLPDPEGVCDGAFALAFDGQGGLWIGTVRGVCRWDGTQFESLDLTGVADPGRTLVRRLKVVGSDQLLVATGRHGVLRWRDGRLERLHLAADDPGRSTYCFCTTTSGETLVGTVAGLYVINGDSLVPAAAPWPRLDRPVYGIIQDRGGRYWFGTDNGVMRWDGANLVHLTNRNGLLGNEVNRDALQMDSGGDIWIGTDAGVTRYRAEFDRAPQAAPLVSLVGFEVDGQSYGPDQALRLSAPPQNLIVSYRGITFRDESRAHYLTRLDGVDKDWQGPYPWLGGKARYTHLPAGNYRFHVRVQLSDGTTSNVASSPDIRIEPRLRARWWFMAMVAAIVLGLVWLVASAVSSRRHALRLQGLVSARTRDLERSRELVRGEKQRLGAILESISDGVVALDAQGRVAMCNAAVERILERPEDRILGRPYEEALVFDPPLSLEPGAPSVHTLTAADGGSIWCELSVAPIREPDHEAVGTVLALRDITERRAMEDQRIKAQQLESLGVLAGGIAHDFNNLLTVILGNVTLIEDAAECGSEQRLRLDRIKGATENARTLTDQFLTFARGGAPRLAPVLLAEAVRQVAALVFSGRSVAYELDLAPDLAPVAADRGQLCQVLQNLFLNACQASAESGTVTVRAWNQTAAADDDGGAAQVVLQVIDEGEGIAAGDLNRIFDPYFTTKKAGSGLGLAVANSIVHHHGGRLSVASEPGRGSVFTLHIPVAEDAVEPVAAQDLPVSDLAGNILVLDDEEEVLEIYNRLLPVFGLTCVCTRTGSEALAAYETARAAGAGFDAVVMDLTIPGGMGGQETAGRLLSRDPAARIIVASGYSNDPVLANYEAYGFQGVLPKPFDKSHLRQVLQRILTGTDTG